MSQDLSRLKSNLANGKIRETDFPTYQVINALINEISQLKKALEIRATSAEGGIGGLKELEYLTSVDESSSLPNSREFLAGSNIAFDDSVANERTISGSAAGITELTGDVTAGPGSGSQVATIANDVVSYAKIQNVSAASRLLGRGSSGGAGDVEELTVGGGLSFSGTVLSSSDIDRQWDVLTDGDLVETELIFASGEVVMVSVP